MSDNLITPEEIKMLRAGAKTITHEIVVKALTDGNIFMVVPLKLKSGYLISMTYDKLNDRMIAEHVSVSRDGGPTDPADAEIIARSVIGECSAREGMLKINNIHFIKIVRNK